MTDYDSYIDVSIIASVYCAECGNTDDASGGEESEVVAQLARGLKREGWQVIDGNLYCADCARNLKPKKKLRKNDD